jgi:hypothetical protein
MIDIAIPFLAMITVATFMSIYLYIYRSWFPDGLPFPYDSTLLSRGISGKCTTCNSSLTLLGQLCSFPRRLPFSSCFSCIASWAILSPSPLAGIAQGHLLYAAMIPPISFCGVRATSSIHLANMIQFVAGQEQLSSSYSRWSVSSTLYGGHGRRSTSSSRVISTPWRTSSLHILVLRFHVFRVQYSMHLAPVRLCRFPYFHRCVPFAVARPRAFALSFASAVCEMASSLGSTSATRPARSIPSSPSSFPVSSGSHLDLADGENKPHCRPSELAFPDNLAEVFGASNEETGQTICVHAKMKHVSCHTSRVMRQQ